MCVCVGVGGCGCGCVCVCMDTSIALHGAETWTLLKVDGEYPESFAVWCWRRMEKISWTDRVRSEVLLKIQGAENILHNKREG